MIRRDDLKLTVYRDKTVHDCGCVSSRVLLSLCDKHTRLSIIAIKERLATPSATLIKHVDYGVKVR